MLSHYLGELYFFCVIFFVVYNVVKGCLDDRSGS